MKRIALFSALAILSVVTLVSKPSTAQAESRIYVGVDLGPVIAAFDHGPRYVYPVPVVHKRHYVSHRPHRIYHKVRHHRYAPPERWYRYNDRHRPSHRWHDDRRHHNRH
ncbi:hypothetical protein JWJ90_12670 [Desulfobulbus rhabdoformis]|uniref:hypothetical protein n=1 Tax=Desulfobulbus rhabdoformis TaxID=34032 RepID=UPI001966884A|nr:hypothetical protein [Desulfobulbus rhabdoformis]MBM9615132.1 hypothetical protein [Desulfobulbus rhabdoformis]